LLQSDAPVHEADFRKTKLPRVEDRLTVGDRLRVSPICIGMVDDPATVPAAFDLGVNFFFLTVDMHWPRYDGLRRGLSMLFERGTTVRDQVAVALVSYVTQPEFCFTPFDETTEAVPGLGRADLTVIGGTYASDFFVRHERFKTHRNGTIKGGASALGASFHDRAAAGTALSHGLVDLGFVRYNATHPGAEKDLFPLLRARDKVSRLFAFATTIGHVKPELCDELGLSKEHWRPEHTDHYRFALTRSEIDGVLCAPSTPAEARGIARALEKPPLDDEEIVYLKNLAALAAGNATLDPK
jgi:hypothetical protein